QGGAQRVSRRDGPDPAGVRESAAEAHQGLHRRTLQLEGGRVMNLRGAAWLFVLTALGLQLSAASPAIAQTSAGGKVVLQGARATFPAPLYKKWIGVFTAQNPDVGVEYKDVGSGEGVQRFLAQTVDFGASDAAMTDEQMARVANGARLVPATAGMVVLAYNLPGVRGAL